MWSNYFHSSSQSALDDIMKFYKMGNFFLNFCNQELESTLMIERWSENQTDSYNVYNFFLGKKKECLFILV